MNKALLVIGLVIIAVGGWYAYSQRADGEGDNPGSVKQDVRVIVGETIQGTWQSTEDAKFVRTFKDDYTVADMYDGKAVSTGTYAVFTKENPLAVSFPLEDNAVYVQLVMSGNPAETLNFKVSLSANADTLTLTYMDRGGALIFTRLK
jgi:hypothetical protein